MHLAGSVTRHEGRLPWLRIHGSEETGVRRSGRREKKAAVETDPSHPPPRNRDIRHLPPGEELPPPVGG